MAYGSKILGTGMHHPEREVSNHDLAQIMDTSDEWIQQRSGIVTRRFVDEGTNTSDLAYEASKEALERALARSKRMDIPLSLNMRSEAFRNVFK